MNSIVWNSSLEILKLIHKYSPESLKLAYRVDEYNDLNAQQLLDLLRKCPEKKYTRCTRY
jgi:hypothetical protein